MLGLITLVGLAGIIAVDLRGSWRTFEAFEAVQRSRGAVSGIAHESFDGALTVKALGREEYETERMARSSEALRDDIIRVNRLWAFYGAFIESFPAVGTVVLLMVGAVRLRSGAITAGRRGHRDLPAVPAGHPDAAHGLGVLGPGPQPGRLAAGGGGAVGGRLRGARRPGGDPAAYGGGGGRRGVGFHYTPGEVVLAGVELDIPPGRTVAVVGPTGSGKSTLAMLLVRLWDPETGAITLDGRDLRRFARAELPREVAFVPQEAFLFNDDVRGNITLGTAIPEEHVAAAVRLAGADGFVGELPQGLATRLGERGTTLSGGQRQRVALARALARRPRLLVLDDATSAVDPSVEAEILRGLREADLPSTVVVVAYRPSSIALADSVIYLDEGRVVAHGRHADLLATQPGYARLLQAYEDDAAARRAEKAHDGTEGRRDDRPPALDPDTPVLGARVAIGRALREAPAVLRGFPLTLLLMTAGTAMQVVVPIAIQQIVDGEILAPGGVDVGRGAAPRLRGPGGHRGGGRGPPPGPGAHADGLGQRPVRPAGGHLPPPAPPLDPARRGGAARGPGVPGDLGHRHHPGLHGLRRASA